MYEYLAFIGGFALIVYGVGARRILPVIVALVLLVSGFLYTSTWGKSMVEQRIVDPQGNVTHVNITSYNIAPEARTILLPSYGILIIITIIILVLVYVDSRGGV